MGLLRDAAGATVGQVWDDLGSYDEADVSRFLERATPVVAATQTQAAVLTDAYVAAEAGRPPLGVDPAIVAGAAVRAGTPPEEVYRRPFVQVWKALAEGTDWTDAIAAARARVSAVAETDVQLSMRAAMADISARDGRIVGYRRVLTGKSCGLCALASTQRYHKGELAPIHARCDCSVAPIFGNRDPGRVLNRRVPRADPAEVAVHEHGELGPVLAVAGQQFTQL